MLIAYHGSKYRFNNFDLSRLGSAQDYGTLGNGIYFTLDQEVAAHYAGSGGYIYKCRLNLNKPYIIDNKEKERVLTTAQYAGIDELCYSLNLSLSDESTYQDSRVVKAIQENNKKFFKQYDGCIAYWSQIPDIVLDNDEVCVFDTSAIEIIECTQVK